jgi:hypothetical protein
LCDHSAGRAGRVGVRFHVFSRDRPIRVIGREQHPTRRTVVRDLVRVEYRNFFYGGAKEGTESSWRFRNRLEFLVPLNKARISDDGARYLLADWEWFLPLEDHEERFANKQRIGRAWDIAGTSTGVSRRFISGRARATRSKTTSARPTTSSTSA